ncbi:hypothetical protein DIPPA_29980, partial [Diplonema papillatum]
QTTKVGGRGDSLWYMYDPNNASRCGYSDEDGVKGWQKEPNWTEQNNKGLKKMSSFSDRLFDSDEVHGGVWNEKTSDAWKKGSFSMFSTAGTVKGPENNFWEQNKGSKQWPSYHLDDLDKRRQFGKGKTRETAVAGKTGVPLANYAMQVKGSTAETYELNSKSSMTRSCSYHPDNSKGWNSYEPRNSQNNFADSGNTGTRFNNGSEKGTAMLHEKGAKNDSEQCGKGSQKGVFGDGSSIFDTGTSQGKAANQNNFAKETTCAEELTSTLQQNYALLSAGTQKGNKNDWHSKGSKTRSSTHLPRDLARGWDLCPTYQDTTAGFLSGKKGTRSGNDGSEKGLAELYGKGAKNNVSEQYSKGSKKGVSGNLSDISPKFDTRKKGKATNQDEHAKGTTYLEEDISKLTSAGTEKGTKNDGYRKGSKTRSSSHLPDDLLSGKKGTSSGNDDTETGSPELYQKGAKNNDSEQCSKGWKKGVSGNLSDISSNSDTRKKGKATHQDEHAKGTTYLEEDISKLTSAGTEKGTKNDGYRKGSKTRSSTHLPDDFLSGKKETRSGNDGTETGPVELHGKGAKNNDYEQCSKGSKKGVSDNLSDISSNFDTAGFVTREEGTRPDDDGTEEGVSKNDDEQSSKVSRKGVSANLPDGSSDFDIGKNPCKGKATKQDEAVEEDISKLSSAGTEKGAKNHGYRKGSKTWLSTHPLDDLTKASAIHQDTTAGFVPGIKETRSDTGTAKDITELHENKGVKNNKGSRKGVSGNLPDVSSDFDKGRSLCKGKATSPAVADFSSGKHAKGSAYKESKTHDPDFMVIGQGETDLSAPLSQFQEAGRSASESSPWDKETHSEAQEIMLSTKGTVAGLGNCQTDLEASRERNSQKSSNDTEGRALSRTGEVYEGKGFDSGKDFGLTKSDHNGMKSFVVQRYALCLASISSDSELNVKGKKAVPMDRRRGGKDTEQGEQEEMISDTKGESVGLHALQPRKYFFVVSHAVPISSLSYEVAGDHVPLNVLERENLAFIYYAELATSTVTLCIDEKKIGVYSLENQRVHFISKPSTGMLTKIWRLATGSGTDERPLTGFRFVRCVLNSLISARLSASEAWMIVEAIKPEVRGFAEALMVELRQNVESRNLNTVLALVAGFQTNVLRYFRDNEKEFDTLASHCFEKNITNLWLNDFVACCFALDHSVWMPLYLRCGKVSMWTNGALSCGSGRRHPAERPDLRLRHATECMWFMSDKLSHFYDLVAQRLSSNFLDPSPLHLFNVSGSEDKVRDIIHHLLLHSLLPRVLEKPNVFETIFSAVLKCPNLAFDQYTSSVANALKKNVSVLCRLPRERIEHFCRGLSIWFNRELLGPSLLELLADHSGEHTVYCTVALTFNSDTDGITTWLADVFEILFKSPVTVISRCLEALTALEGHSSSFLEHHSEGVLQSLDPLLQTADPNRIFQETLSCGSQQLFRQYRMHEAFAAKLSQFVEKHFSWREAATVKSFEAAVQLPPSYRERFVTACLHQFDTTRDPCVSVADITDGVVSFMSYVQLGMMSFPFKSHPGQISSHMMRCARTVIKDIMDGKADFRLLEFLRENQALFVRFMETVETNAQVRRSVVASVTASLRDFGELEDLHQSICVVVPRFITPYKKLFAKDFVETLHFVMARKPQQSAQTIREYRDNHGVEELFCVSHIPQELLRWANSDIFRLCWEETLMHPSGSLTGRALDVVSFSEAYQKIQLCVRKLQNFLQGIGNLDMTEFERYFSHIVDEERTANEVTAFLPSTVESRYTEACLNDINTVVRWRRMHTKCKELLKVLQKLARAGQQVESDEPDELGEVDRVLLDIVSTSEIQMCVSLKDGERPAHELRRTFACTLTRNSERLLDVLLKEEGHCVLQAMTKPYFAKAEDFHGLIELLSANPCDGVSAEVAACVARVRAVLLESVMQDLSYWKSPRRPSDVVRRLQMSADKEQWQASDFESVFVSLDRLDRLHEGLTDDSGIDDLKTAAGVQRCVFTWPNLDLRDRGDIITQRFMAFEDQDSKTYTAQQVLDLRDRLLLNSIAGEATEIVTDFAHNIALCCNLAQLRWEQATSGCLGRNVLSYYRGPAGVNASEEQVDVLDLSNIGDAVEDAKRCLRDHRDGVPGLLQNYACLSFFTVNQGTRLVASLDKTLAKDRVEAWHQLCYMLPYMSFPEFEQQFQGWRRSRTRSARTLPALERLGEYLKNFEKQAFENQCLKGANECLSCVATGELNLVLTKYDAQLLDVLQVFVEEGIVPRLSQVLFCFPDTAVEEVSKILWRSRHSAQVHREAGSLHCIVNAGCLPVSQQEDVVKELKNILGDSNLRFRIVFIESRSRRSQLSDHLSRYQRTLHAPAEDSFTSLYSALFGKGETGRLCVFESSGPSAGKSYLIAEKAKRSGLSLVHVPVQLACSDLLIYRRLVQGRQEPVAYHINIDTSASRQSLCQIFNLVFLRQLRLASGACFTIKREDRLFVELPCMNQKAADELFLFTRSNPSPLPRVVVSPVTNPADIGIEPNSSEFGQSAQYVLKHLRGLAELRLSTAAGDLDPSTEPPVARAEATELLQAHGIAIDDVQNVRSFVAYLACQLRQMQGSDFLKHGLAVWDPGADGTAGGVRDCVVNNLCESAKDFALGTAVLSIATSSRDMSGPSATVHGNIGFPVVQRWKELGRPLMVFNQATVHEIGGFGDLSLVCSDVRLLKGNDIALWQGQGMSGHSVFRDFQESSHSQDQTIKRERIALLLRIFGNCANGEELDGLQKKLVANPFALTFDNVLKMIAMTTRVKCGIPCLLEGESGCGKTALVQYLADLLGIPLVQADVHGGYTADDVIDKVNEAGELSGRDVEQTVWLFFDEVNTGADVMGMFKEILCDRTCLGEELPPRVCVVMACNPHRENMSSCHEAQLVYDVVPLPPSFVLQRWVFGCLSARDERMYVAEIVVEHLGSLQSEALFGFLKRCLPKAHQFMREHYSDVSVCSLRDVARCTRLCAWWAKLKTSSGQQYLTNPLDAGILAVAVTYYFRLPEVARSQFVVLVDSIIGRARTAARFLQVLCDHLRRLETYVRTPAGVCFNDVLRENVFISFVCAQNAIPVVMVGEPGCSKTLSVSLLFQHNNQFEQHGFKRLQPVAFQCTKLTTAQAIEARFDYALSYQLNRKSDDLAVLWFDEIGLAEQSESRPTKVLHRLLENPEVSFIGLSNWALDAAKMNRVVMHTCQNTTSQALTDTARTIMNEALQVEDIGVVVRTYTAIVRDQPVPGFFGKRDFYAALRSLALSQTILRSFERNFGGAGDHHRYIHSILAKELPQRFLKAGLPVAPCPLLLVQESVLDDARSASSDSLRPRHVMCLTENDFFWRSLVGSGSLGNPSSLEVIIGSDFLDDKGDTLSVYRRVNHFRSCMLVGKTVILVCCDDMYGSLYSALNLQYTYLNSKRFVRIALGSESMQTRVHDNFRCVIVALQEDAKSGRLELPFLSRFEKQHVRWIDLCRSSEEVVTVLLHVSSSLNIKLRGSEDEGEASREEAHRGPLLSAFDLKVLSAAMPGFCSETVPSAVSLFPGEPDNAVEALLNAATPFAAMEATDTAIDLYMNRQSHFQLLQLVGDIKSGNMVIRTFAHEVSPHELEQWLEERGIPAYVRSLRALRSISRLEDLLVDMSSWEMAKTLVLTMVDDEITPHQLSHVLHCVDKAYPTDRRVIALLHLTAHESIPLVLERKWSTVFVDQVMCQYDTSLRALQEAVRTPLQSLVLQRAREDLALYFHKALGSFFFPYRREVNVLDIAALLNSCCAETNFAMIVYECIDRLCADLEKPALHEIKAEMTPLGGTAPVSATRGSFNNRLERMVSRILVSCVQVVLRCILPYNSVGLLNANSGSDEEIRSLWYAILPEVLPDLARDVSTAERHAVSWDFDALFPFTDQLSKAMTDSVESFMMLTAADVKRSIALFRNSELNKLGDIINSLQLSQHAAEAYTSDVLQLTGCTREMPAYLVDSVSQYVVGNWPSTETRPITEIHTQFFLKQHFVKRFCRLLCSVVNGGAPNLSAITWTGSEGELIENVMDCLQELCSTADEELLAYATAVEGAAASMKYFEQGSSERWQTIRLQATVARILVVPASPVFTKQAYHRVINLLKSVAYGASFSDIVTLTESIYKLSSNNEALLRPAANCLIEICLRWLLRFDEVLETEPDLGSVCDAIKWLGGREVTSTIPFLKLLRQAAPPLGRQKVASAVANLLARSPQFFDAVSYELEDSLMRSDRNSFAAMLLRGFHQCFSTLEDKSAVLRYATAATDEDNFLEYIRNAGAAKWLFFSAAKTKLSAAFSELPVAIRKLLSSSGPLTRGVHLLWGRVVFSELGVANFGQKARDGHWSFLIDSPVKALRVVASTTSEAPNNPFVALGDQFWASLQLVESGKHFDTADNSYLRGCVCIAATGHLSQHPVSVQDAIQRCHIDIPGFCGFSTEAEWQLVRHWAVLVSTFTQNEFFRELLLRPESFLNASVPGIPDAIVIQIPPEVRGTREWVCPNGHSFFVGNCGALNQGGRCIECGLPVGGAAQNNTMAVRPASSAVVQGLPIDRDTLGVADQVRGMSTSERLTIALFVYLTLEVHFSRTNGDNGNLLAILRRPNATCIDAARCMHGLTTFILERLAQSIERNLDDTTILVHLIVHRVTAHSEPDFHQDWGTAEARQAFEEWFTENCTRPVLRDVASSLQLIQRSNDLLQVSRELDGPGLGQSDESYAESYLPSFWHREKNISLEFFVSSVWNTKDVLKSVPLVAAIAKHLTVLLLLQDLTALAEWSMQVWQLYHRKKHRMELQKVTVSECMAHSRSSAVLWKRFVAVWNRLAASSLEFTLECQAVRIPLLPVDGKGVDLLLTTISERSGTRHLEVLVSHSTSLHNEVLEDLLSASKSAGFAPAETHNETLDTVTAADGVVISTTEAAVLRSVADNVFVDDDGAMGIDFESLQREFFDLIPGKAFLTSRLPALQFRDTASLVGLLSDDVKVCELSDCMVEDLKKSIRRPEQAEVGLQVVGDCSDFCGSCLKNRTEGDLHKLAVDDLKLAPAQCTFLTAGKNAQQPLLIRHLTSLARFLEYHLFCLDKARVPSQVGPALRGELSAKGKAQLKTYLTSIESGQSYLLQFGLWKFLLRQGANEGLQPGAPLHEWLGGTYPDDSDDSFGELDWYQGFPSTLHLSASVEVYSVLCHVNQE